VKMYTVKVHERINQITSVFYRMGLWHRGDKATVTATTIKIFYSIYYALFVISLLGGGIQSENMNESIFLVLEGITAFVQLIKLLYIIWKKNEIDDMLNRIAVYSMKEEEGFKLASDTINGLMKFSTVFISLVYFTGLCITLFIPFLASERTLFFNLAFPLDWKNNDMAYLSASVFIFTQVVLTITAILFSVIIWYLLINCALRYKILGYQIKNMGVVKTVEGPTSNQIISNVEKERKFRRDLVAVIESYNAIKKYKRFSRDGGK